VSLTPWSFSRDNFLAAATGATNMPERLQVKAKQCRLTQAILRVAEISKTTTKDTQKFDSMAENVKNEPPWLTMFGMTK